MNKKYFDWLLKGIGLLLAALVVFGMALGKYAGKLGNVASDAVPSVSRSAREIASDSGFVASRGVARSAHLIACSHNNTNSTTLNVTATITANPYLNIRQFPNPKATVIGKVRTGRYKLDILSVKNCWINVGFVSTGGIYTRGYVSGKYVKLEEK